MRALTLTLRSTEAMDLMLSLQSEAYRHWKGKRLATAGALLRLAMRIARESDCDLASLFDADLDRLAKDADLEADALALADA